MENNKNPKGNFDLNLDEAAVQLLRTLEKRNNKVKNFLIKHYRGLPVSPEYEEKAYNYFINHSVIITAMATSRGSSVITEFLYQGIPSPSPIDNYVLNCKTGKAVRSRLVAIEEEVPKIIEEYRNNNKNNNKKKILIGNLGSGPGRDVINVLVHYHDDSDIKAIHIDKDEVALKRGIRIAKSKGVGHLIDFVQGNFLKYNPTEKFDIILLIGVLCPLDTETCIVILKTIKNLLKEDGLLIVSNASKKMQKEDPFACYIMEWTANWKLVFKNEEEMKQIFKKAGYAWKKRFRDASGFHLMAVGTPIFN